jgi:hypothetical protein
MAGGNQPLAKVGLVRYAISFASGFGVRHE